MKNLSHDSRFPTQDLFSWTSWYKALERNLPNLEWSECMASSLFVRKDLGGIIYVLFSSYFPKFVWWQ
jgi:hypothetical protein